MLVTLAAHADEAQVQRLLETLLAETSDKAKVAKAQ